MAEWHRKNTEITVAQNNIATAEKGSIIIEIISTSGFKALNLNLAASVQPAKDLLCTTARIEIVVLLRLANSTHRLGLANQHSLLSQWVAHRQAPPTLGMRRLFGKCITVSSCCRYIITENKDSNGGRARSIREPEDVAVAGWVIVDGGVRRCQSKVGWPFGNVRYSSAVWRRGAVQVEHEAKRARATTPIVAMFRQSWDGHA
ncbi:hypothetical protein EI94DRAFT_1786545 [Lactarius quietus]|nr:hypothetical protein EI94DRAFT_1786545 [Lactarius quietus]